MGVFSWKCAKSGVSIACEGADKPLWQSQCVLVTPMGNFYEMSYEGYGEFGGKDVYELLGDGNRDLGLDRHFSGTAKFDIKVVLRCHYEGESYEELPVSEECEYQGYFF